MAGASEMSPEILGAIGFVITCLLGINAKFIWSLLVSIKNIELNITKYIANHESIEKRVDDIEESRREDKTRFLPMIEDFGRRIAVLEKEAEEIEGLRKAKHDYGNILTAHDGRILAIERNHIKK